MRWFIISAEVVALSLILHGPSYAQNNALENVDTGLVMFAEACLPPPGSEGITSERMVEHLVGLGWTEIEPAAGSGTARFVDFLRSLADTVVRVPVYTLSAADTQYQLILVVEQQGTVWCWLPISTSIEPLPTAYLIAFFGGDPVDEYRMPDGSSRLDWSYPLNFPDWELIQAIFFSQESSVGLNGIIYAASWRSFD